MGLFFGRFLAKSVDKTTLFVVITDAILGRF